MRKYSYFPLYQIIALLVCVQATFPGNTASGTSTDAFRVLLPVVLVNYYTPPMKVVETVLSRSKTGNYYLTGNLQNQGPDTVYDVGVRVHLYDEQSQLLDIYTTTSILPANFPGQFNAFYHGTLINTFDFPNAYCVTEVISWTLDSSLVYGQLTLVSSQVEDIGSAARVQAVFRNDTPNSLMDLHPLIWELHQYDYESIPIPSSLASGDSFDYTIDLWGVYGLLIPFIKIEGQGAVEP